MSIAITHTALGKARLPDDRVFNLRADAVTPVMLAFDALLIAVRAYVSAEFELEEAGGWDPACRVWRDEADAAFARMEGRVLAMRGLRPALPGDRPLLRMRLLIGIMLRTTSPCDLARAHGVMTTHAMMFECAGADPVEVRVTALLRRGRSLVDSLAALPSFVDADEGFDLGFGADGDLTDGHAFDDFVEAA
jgi:hypothetical protein